MTPSDWWDLPRRWLRVTLVYLVVPLSAVRGYSRVESCLSKLKWRPDPEISLANEAGSTLKINLLRRKTWPQLVPVVNAYDREKLNVSFISLKQQSWQTLNNLGLCIRMDKVRLWDCNQSDSLFNSSFLCRSLSPGLLWWSPKPLPVLYFQICALLFARIINSRTF